MRSRLAYALFGVLATLVGVAAGHFVASLLNTASSPVLAVGSQVIDLTPTPMKEWAIARFGSNDKRVLIGSVMGGVLVLAAVAGLLARRRFAYGAALQLVLVGVAAFTALHRPAAEPLDVVPSLATAVAGVGALWLLDRRATPAPLPIAESARPVAPGRPGHRRGARRGRGLHGRHRPVDREVPRPAHRHRVPEARRPGAGVPDRDRGGLSRDHPAAGPDRRVLSRRHQARRPDRGHRRLVAEDRRDGRQGAELTFDDLLAMPLVERDITLTCVSNSVGGPYVGGARWIGVRLSDLLDMAGVQDGVDQIFSTDVDGMTIGTPYELATDGRDAMIALGMNGAALPREHGYPARMVVPGLYGFISACKWIERITLTTYAAKDSYWTKRDWATNAPIKISSRIDTPQVLETIDAGDTFIGGIAWAQQNGGVAKVQVQIDGGAWQDAMLGPSAGNDYWRQWYFPGRPSPAPTTSAAAWSTARATLSPPPG